VVLSWFFFLLALCFLDLGSGYLFSCKDVICSFFFFPRRGLFPLVFFSLAFRLLFFFFVCLVVPFRAGSVRYILVSNNKCLFVLIFFCREPKEQTLSTPEFFFPHQPLPPPLSCTANAPSRAAPSPHRHRSPKNATPHHQTAFFSQWLPSAFCLQGFTAHTPFHPCFLASRRPPLLF